jgi:hypothetical protein
LLWRARHFITLRLPTGSRLVRRRDFAYGEGIGLHLGSMLA